MKAKNDVLQEKSLEILVRSYYDYQNERIALDGRLGRKKNGDIKAGIPDRDDEMLLYLMSRRDEVYAFEKEIEKSIKAKVHTYPLWDEFLLYVKGCGEIMAAVLLTQIDICKAVSVSNLWSFAGLAPGKDRKVKGQKCTYNQFLKSKLLGVLGSGFLKSKSPYADFYYNMKNRLESEGWGVACKNPSDKKRPKAGHQHMAANRYMVKMFLKDLYVAWRTIEGLEVREPYQEEYLGKRHIS
jgi:hypothetical protein